jgi:hypothetical protein
MMQRLFMKKKTLFTIILLFFTALSIRAHWEEHDINGQYLFGYAGVGDKPSLYMPEIEANRIPTNVQSLEVNLSTDNLTSRINYLSAHGQRAFIVLDDLLFIHDPNLPTPCGADSWRNRLDYQVKFTNWFNLNAPNLTPGKVAALVINTEVNNRCIPSYSLDAVTKFVTARIPSIPTLAGYGRSGAGAKPLPDQIPASLAGALFFKYEILDPRTDDSYQQEFSELKARLSAQQRIVLVPDGFYSGSHAQRGWPKWYLGYLALNYAELAKSDPQVVGLIFFLWSSFGEGDGLNIGSRDLPQSIRDRQRLAGCNMNIQSSLTCT